MVYQWCIADLFPSPNCKATIDFSNLKRRLLHPSLKLTLLRIMLYTTAYQITIDRLCGLVEQKADNLLAEIT